MGSKIFIKKFLEVVLKSAVFSASRRTSIYTETTVY